MTSVLVTTAPPKIPPAEVKRHASEPFALNIAYMFPPVWPAYTNLLSTDKAAAD